MVIQVTSTVSLLVVDDAPLDWVKQIAVGIVVVGVLDVGHCDEALLEER